EIQRQLSLAEEAHRKNVHALEKKQSSSKQAEDPVMKQERDAYKLASTTLLDERAEIVKERDRIAAELALERKNHGAKIQELTKQCEEASAKLDRANQEYKSQMD